ncbi:unnamed protein product [Leptidea sinapis]|uniref:Uncharacterized protein n=1 Tax=Leptidea sinapis TaxID=189913 RepID=A0A5E4PTS2_9NEOP|nr:unnamed protein product [Leptidea sinapis]
MKSARRYRLPWLSPGGGVGVGSVGPASVGNTFSNMYERDNMSYDAEKPHDYHYPQEQGNGVGDTNTAEKAGQARPSRKARTCLRNL